MNNVHVTIKQNDELFNMICSQYVSSRAYSLTYRRQIYLNRLVLDHLRFHHTSLQVTQLRCQYIDHYLSQLKATQYTSRNTHTHTKTKNEQTKKQKTRQNKNNNNNNKNKNKTTTTTTTTINKTKQKNKKNAPQCSSSFREGSSTSSYVTHRNVDKVECERSFAVDQFANLVPT